MSLTVEAIEWAKPTLPRVLTDAEATIRLQDVFLTDFASVTLKANGRRLSVHIPLAEWMLSLSAFLRRASTSGFASADELMTFAGEKFVAHAQAEDVSVELYDPEIGTVNVVATKDEWRAAHDVLKVFLVGEARHLLPEGARLRGCEAFDIG